MPTALITGASSGIGQAYAKRLASEGYDLVAVGRRRERLEELAGNVSVDVTVITADLADKSGIDAVVEVASTRPIDLLINNAGVAHYMPLADLPPEKLQELVSVKMLLPPLLTRAVLPGMLERGHGAVVNVAGMIAFAGPAPSSLMPRRVVYAQALAGLVAMSQTLSAELEGTGVQVQALCPGVVATEFHTVQGLDLSAVPRMSADDVVTASRVGLRLGEVVCAPGVEDASLLEKISAADLEAFGAQSPELASRYRD